MSAHEIQFTYEKDRAYNATLWLLHQHGGMLNRLKLIKLVFLADLEHLAKYGRPIVGGRYVAMKHGPVASELLSDIQRRTPGLPFSPVNLNVVANQPVNEEYLAESDIEVLRDVNTEFGDYDRFALRNRTHRYNSWSKNFLGENTSYPLPYEDFFLDVPEERRVMLDVIRDTQDAWGLLS